MRCVHQSLSNKSLPYVEEEDRFLRDRDGHEMSSRKLCLLDTARLLVKGKKNQFFLVEPHWEYQPYQPYFRVGSQGQEELTNKMDFFCGLFLCLIFFGLFFKIFLNLIPPLLVGFIFILWFCFLFIYLHIIVLLCCQFEREREKGHKTAWVEIWGRSQRNWGRERHYQNILYEKPFQ